MDYKRYGYFDNNAREYVITNPHTPVKWINYIGSLDFGGFVDHTGGALLCKGDPAQNRITRYIQQDPSSAFKGTTLYLRVKSDSGSAVLCPLYVPGLAPWELYECHVGLGYTRIVSRFAGITTEVLILVPLGAPCEVRKITVTNSTNAPLSIDIVPVVEYSHPLAVMLFTNADWVPQTMQSNAFYEPHGRIILTQAPFMHAASKINFFSTNRAVDSFESDRKVFLGNNEYGGWHNPVSLQQEHFSNSCASRGENIAALLIPLGVLAPQESLATTTILGQTENVGQARTLIAQYCSPRSVDTALTALRDSWGQHLNTFQVATPDTGMNNMLNIWNQYQCMVTKNWSRYLSYYQLGMGERGIGLRDSMQDILGIVHAQPEQARVLIEMLLSIQRENGSAFHQVNPLSGQPGTGECSHSSQAIDYYGDDHLWGVLAVCKYVKETGNRSFLDTLVPYYTDSASPVSASVYDHLLKAVTFTHANVGAHGLPLLGYADWNDTINLPAGAESFFIAALYGLALRELMDVCLWTGNAVDRELFQTWHDEMSCTVNTHGWNGSWYNRYLDNEGVPLGHPDCAVGKIYTNGQSWPVLAGFAAGEHAQIALEAVRQHLWTKNGIKIATPGYPAWVPGAGGIATYPPGAKENGGIFLHTNPWVIIAETMLGNGDRAFEYYRAINPADKNECIDNYEVEPYVYAQNILSDEHPLFGLGRNSWLSGTAAWAFTAATSYILGIRADYDGLVVDPCIPSTWDGFSCTREFRGCTFRIKVKNPDHCCKGVKTLIVNGKSIAPSVIPVGANDTIIDVECILGR